MKKFTIILTILIATAITTNAQWTTQTSPRGTEILGRMQFVSATEGWIVCGASGSMIHTTNAGSTWTSVTPFPADTAMGNSSDVGLTMSWPNATHGWALKTYGYNNNNSGFTNGATLYQTINSGANWTKKDFPALVPSVTYSAADLVGTWQMHGLSIDKPGDATVNDGWVYGTVTVDVSGNSTTNYTNNQGQTGTRNSVATTVNSKGIITLSGTDVHGFISADKKTIIYTQSAGNEGYMLIVWQKVNPATVYSTADLQGTWQMHSIQTQSNAGWSYGTTTMDVNGSGSMTGFGSNNIQFNSLVASSISSTGIVTSSSNDSKGFMSADKQTIYLTQSQNGGYCLNILQKVVTGTTYSAKDMMGIWQLHGLKIGNSSSAWVRCQYKISSTGSTAYSKMVQNNVSGSDGTSSINIAADGTLTGFGSADANGFLSADKSLGLNTLSDGSGGYYLSIYQKDLSANGDGGMQVQFADNNTGWVSVYNSIYGYFLIYKTTNGGINWDVINGVTNPVGGYYYFRDALNGWMFGASNTTIGTNTDILHTTDGGLSWTTQVANAGSPHAIHFSDINNGWIVGYNGLVMHTTDGGAHWTTLTNLGLDPSAKNKAVFALNSNICYISSGIPNTQGGRNVLKTTNGGGSWTTIPTPFQYDIFNIYFWTENNGWISGDYGEIAHYSSNTGVNNPTNQLITISPNPTSDFIKVNGIVGTCPILIYDISGKCVINDKIETENRVDIRSLSAGIYFLKLNQFDNNEFIKFIKN